MTLRRTALLPFVSALVLLAVDARAETVFSLDGIPGTSVLAKAPPGSIDATGFTFTAVAAGGVAPGGGTAAPKTTATDLSITRRADRASPALLAALLSGKRFKTLSLTVLRTGQATYRVTAYDAILTNAQHRGVENDAVPTEVLTVEFSRAEVEVLAPDAKGGVVSTGKTTFAGRRP
jgi:type VI protein secretion system component Hcp